MAQQVGNQAAGHGAARIMQTVGDVPAVGRRVLVAAVLGVAAGANLTLLSPAPLALRAVAALVVAALLPGALLVEWLVGRSEAPPGRWERSLYSIGAGYAVMILAMLALSYLPGGLARWQTLLAFNLLLFALLLLAARHWSSNAVSLQPSTFNPSTGSGQALQPSTELARRWLLAGMIALLLIGGFYRLVNLGYSEFQGDEARAVLRAAAVIQGYEDVLLIHRKGPSEILVPTVLYALTGQMTEYIARLPFALANLSALFALFLLGRRLFGAVAGWTAAVLLALDGYFIGFSRIVQYQSVVFLTSVLVVLILYRLARLSEPAEVSRTTRPYLVLAALLAGTGFLSHYEAALVAVPGAYLLWKLAQRMGGFKPLVRALLPPLLLGAALIACFYVPFVLHPQFGDTYEYLTDKRIGGGLVYNKLADVFVRTTLYSTTYYAVTMVALTVLAVVAVYRRGLRSRWGWLLGALFVVGVVLSVVRPGWLSAGGGDYTVVFFALALIAVWLMPTLAMEERTVWLWFGALMLLAIFFTATPRTHVYVFFIPWALVAGMALQRGWQALRDRLGQRPALAAGAGAAGAAVLVFGAYAYWYFVYNEVEILRTWEQNRPRGFWTVYDAPDDQAIFGFPLQNGWKAVGVLYQQGVIDGTYATNEDDWLFDWYTRGGKACTREHTYYFFIDRLDRKGESRLPELRDQLQRDYQLFGTVLVQGTPRMQIYQRSEAQIEPQTFDSADYEAIFDAEYSGPGFQLSEPALNVQIQQPLHYRLGEHIWLEGFSIADDHVRPGETLHLKLFWRAAQPVPERYTVFNQVIEPGVAIYGQRDREPGCDTDTMMDWQPGELIVDRYQVPIAPDARPGSYPLLTGMYHPGRNERLTVYDAAGQPIGNSVELARITVEGSQ
ncbi:MAG TPA: glycosyltransferase family 39 protein [Ardenticatenaceae bacterium]|nr:glycosyltransferase family 39 protein [Ardenticatenaceae bacterium]